MRFLFWFFLFVPALSAATLAEQLYQHSYSAPAAALGSIGSNPVDGAYYNAALLGKPDKINSGAAVMLANQDRALQAYFFLPGRNGTFALGAAWLESGNRKTGQVSLGFGRDFHRFSSGLYLRPVLGQLQSGSFAGLAIEPALLYHSPLQLGSSGLQISQLNFYLQAHNTGIYTSSLAASWLAGLQFDVFSLGSWQARLYYELRASSGQWPMSAALNLSYKSFSLKTGWLHDPPSPQLQGLSLGLSWFLAWPEGGMHFNYAFLPATASRNNQHYFSLSAAFDYTDRRPPRVSLSAPNSFSPNANGAGDLAHFEAKTTGRNYIADWELRIFDSNQRVVRILSRDRRLADFHGNLFSFLSGFFQREERHSFPHLIWDGSGPLRGLSEISLASLKNDLPEGNYRYILQVKDEAGQSSEPVEGQLFIDNTAPSGQLRLLASPGIPAVEIKSSQQTDETWLLQVLSDQGQLVQSHALSGSEGRSEWQWDGLDQRQKPVPAGYYRYRLSGQDSAGNQSQVETGLFLLAGNNGFGLQVSPGLLSAGDRKLQVKTAQPQSAVKNWQLWLSQRPLPASNQHKSKPLAILAQAEGSLPENIDCVFPGQLGTGRYYLSLVLARPDGSLAFSFSTPVFFDDQGPRLSVGRSAGSFTPDGDGRQEQLWLYPRASDDLPLRWFSLNIYEISQEQGKKNRRLFRQWSGGSSLPQTVYFDGKGDQGNLVESNTLYEVELEAEDLLGNRSVSRPAGFRSGFLLVPEYDGLRPDFDHLLLRISNFRFQDQPGLSADNRRVLRSVARLLRCYSQYRIHVQVHSGNPGNEEGNLQQSEQRAALINDFLWHHGIANDRIFYTGMGETENIVEKEENHFERNNRLEIHLIRPENR